MVKIYTKKGDSGTTELYGVSERQSKDSVIFSALGTVDEANCQLGLVLAQLPRGHQLEILRHQLSQIQHSLFDLGASLATAPTALPRKQAKTRFDEAAVVQLEHDIDAWEAELTPLSTFILPGGHLASAHLHLARALVRRAEREVVSLHAHQTINPLIGAYLNRLSDYLFVVARWVNQITDTGDVKWVPQAKSE